jgi:hypothetical protein
MPSHSRFRQVAKLVALALALPLAAAHAGCSDAPAPTSLRARIEPVSLGGNMVVLLSGHTAQVGWHGTLASGLPADCSLEQDRSIYASEAAGDGSVPLVFALTCGLGSKTQVFGAISLGDLRDASDGEVTPAVERSYLTVDSTAKEGGATTSCTSDASAIHVTATVTGATGGRAAAPKLTTGDFHRHVEVAFTIQSKLAGPGQSGACAAPATFTGTMLLELDATSYAWVRE